MLIVRPGQANVVTLTASARATGAPIVAGTVNLYLQGKTGTNAGKWYKGGVTPTWELDEQIAGAAAHVGDGQWSLSLASAVWTDEVAYLAYLKESGDLHIPIGEDVLCEARDPTPVNLVISDA
jgi:hypothetical protein